MTSSEKDLTDSGHPSQRPAHWAEAGIGPNWRFRFFASMMRWGGKARGYHLANFASAWYALFYPSIRWRLAPYLSRRFPDRRNLLKRRLDTFRVVRSYATTLVDMLVLNMYGRDAFTAVSRDHERFSQIAAHPRGFVLVLAHVGCWQIGMSTLGELKKNVAVVMIPDPGTMVGKAPYRIIDPRGGPGASMEMSQALLDGEVVAVMGDRVFSGGEQTTVPVDFLGDTAYLPLSPYRMASATGVPVVVMTAPRTGKRKYEVRVEAVIDVPAGLGRKAEKYAPYARQFARCMERFVEEFPYQFYNFYDLWTPLTPSPRPPE